MLTPSHESLDVARSKPGPMKQLYTSGVQCTPVYKNDVKGLSYTEGIALDFGPPVRENRLSVSTEFDYVQRPTVTTLRAKN